MAPYDEWNKIEDDDDDELQDGSWFEGKRDVILFAIDCAEAMHVLRDDPKYEDAKTCDLLTALEAAMDIQKRKVSVGPSDAVGIILFNTTRTHEASGQGSDIKKGTFLFQPIETINVAKVKQLKDVVDAAREDPKFLRDTFPPSTDANVPMGDVFTSCNWIMRDGAPKTASKRVFLITNEDDPHPDSKERLVTSARTTLIDLTQAGIVVEPFFIQQEGKSFDLEKFYLSVLLPTNIASDDDEDPDILPEAVSITKVDELLAQMKIREIPKRALFSVPFELAKDFVIGLKGYGLVTEQRKGTIRYFADLGDRMLPANSRTDFVDPRAERPVDKADIMFGMTLGATAAAPAPAPEEDDADEEMEDTSGGGTTRTVPLSSRVFYDAEEVNSFRTLGLEPRLKLLGFKDRDQLAFEDNIKHSYFIYPDEMAYSGSKRTFSALLRSMINKKKIGLVLALFRRNASPTFCAMLPQQENAETGGWNEPPGFHLIPLPFADDIRPASITSSLRASDELKDAAREWIDKLKVKDGYAPDSYPNPALAFHNAQLEAVAFRDEFDPESLEDRTLPKYEVIHKRVGSLMKAWKDGLQQDLTLQNSPDDEDTDMIDLDSEMKERYENGQLSKYRVDELKEFLKSKGLAVSGKKAELIERVGEYLDTHN